MIPDEPQPGYLGIWPHRRVHAAFSHGVSCLASHGPPLRSAHHTMRAAGKITRKIGMSGCLTAPRRVFQCKGGRLLRLRHGFPVEKRTAGRTLPTNPLPEVVGQRHLLGEGKPLANAIQAGVPLDISKGRRASQQPWHDCSPRCV